MCSPPVRRDNVQGRALTGAGYVSTTDMTVEDCITFCDGQSFNYAGLEWYQECYCGNFIVNGGAETTASDCSFPCTGDASEVCGAGNRLSMYYSGRPPPPAPEIVPSVGLWESLGCYTSVGFSCLSSASPSQSHPSQSATTSGGGPFPFQSAFLVTRSKAVLRPATMLVTVWPVPNTLRSVGVARLSKPEAVPLPLPNATCYALATVHSIAVDRIVSIFTIIPALPRLLLLLPLLHLVQTLFTRSPVCLETGPTMGAGCES